MKYQRFLWVLALLACEAEEGADTGFVGAADEGIESDAALSDAALSDAALSDAAVTDAVIDAAVSDAAETDAAVTDAAVREDDQVWAQKEVTATLSELPIVGQTRTENHALVRMILADGVARTETCAVEIRGAPGALTRTIVPDAFVRGLNDQARAVSVVDGVFTGERLVEIDGARLDDEADALPETPEDPRVLDPDEDGNPGLTLRITGLVDGEIYVVQRRISTLSGTLEGDRLSGLISWQSDQRVLGADNPVLTGQVPSRPDPDPAVHTFTALRIDPTRDCAWIVAQRETLFGVGQ